MKLIKKYFIVLLGILTAAQACSLVAAAAESDDINNKIVGDVDGDGLVTVLDATLIQKYIADIIGNDSTSTTPRKYSPTPPAFPTRSTRA